MNVGLIDAVKSTAGQLAHTVNSKLLGGHIPQDWLPQSSNSCTPDDEPSTDAKMVMEHQFEPRMYERAQQYCEKCCGSIWGVLYGFYQCKNCNFKCHNKCLNSITRRCAYARAHEKPEFTLDICPEQGLSAQGYRCAECRQNVFPQQGQPRRCEYTGRYYCSLCHWNSQTIVPARVLHNWDFEPRKVCRASLQFLRLMVRKPILNLDELNPMLFTFVEDLGHVKKLREDILRMKQYLTLCHAAQQQKLLLLLHKRQHFVEGSHMYSLQDLIDLHDGNLLGYLTQVHQVFFDHITKSCEVSAMIDPGSSECIMGHAAAVKCELQITCSSKGLYSFGSTDDTCKIAHGTKYYIVPSKPYEAEYRATWVRLRDLCVHTDSDQCPHVILATHFHMLHDILPSSPLLSHQILKSRSANSNIGVRCLERKQQDWTEHLQGLERIHREDAARFPTTSTHPGLFDETMKHLQGQGQGQHRLP
ncbi:hypothetical protein HPB47_007216 [Ixodes persulcatus]|uniref:Uncharacterized protein n=1 Tax=Ixodes persulcatus TaxID=34615 RepID=A0AC60P832_IXOPE|nr:hypothetical protein HPB47_007216 [Ixodes persulcatus]